MRTHQPECRVKVKPIGEKVYCVVRDNVLKLTVILIVLIYLFV